MTLFDLLIGATRQMGVLEYRTANAGSASSVNVAALRSESADDQFNNGTLFIVSSTGTSTSIDGLFRPIQDYVASSGEFRWAASFAAACTNGTVIAYTNSEFRNELLIDLANDSLRSIGTLDFIDRTTIQTSAAQTAYSGAVAWKYAPPKRIDLLTGVGTSAASPDWLTIGGWHYQPSSAGAAGLIVFDEQLPVGRDIRVWYQDHHHKITASTQAVDERIHPDLAIAALVSKLYEYRNRRSRGGEAYDVQAGQEARLILEQEKFRHPLWKPPRKRRLTIVGNEEDDHLPFPTPYGP